eukprot:evm.model.scf_915.3 EVM.evm.TU.scf_915.3   scf_915:28048-29940(-)
MASFWKVLLGFVVLLLAATFAEGKCADSTFDSACICLNQQGCDLPEYYSGDVQEHATRHCLCESGIELDSLANVSAMAKEHNGVLESLHLSGVQLASLDPLDGALVELTGDLVIKGTRVTTLAPLGNLRAIGGDFRVAENVALASMGGLKSLTEVEGNLEILNNRALTNGSDFEHLRMVGGVLRIYGNDMLLKINGFELLLQVDAFQIENNWNLESITGFSCLGTVTAWECHGYNCGHFAIRFNPNLVSIDGFGNLVTVDGSLDISDNRSLQRLSLPTLAMVFSEANFEANGNLPSFSSSEGFPYREPGCAIQMNVVPEYIKEGTRLERYDCSVTKGPPLMLGFGIIGVTIILSLLIFSHMRFNFYSPSRKGFSVKDFRDSFAVHILALADLLSDLGFTATAFIVSTTEKENAASLDEENIAGRIYVIGLLSVIVVVLSQMWMMIGTWWGLGRAKLLEDIGLPEDPLQESPPSSLLQYLKVSGRMSMRDWLLVYPGMLVFDTEAIKHLPWGEDLFGAGNKFAKNGFPHVYFAGLAFWSAVIEDIPQIALQIWFIFAVEEDNGWAITGAMASLTVSVADALVRVVFPMLVRSFARKYPLKRQNHMLIGLRTMRTGDKNGLLGGSNDEDEEI